MSDTSKSPAGWYSDSEVPGGLRYWDGLTWTDSRLAAPDAPALSAKRSVPKATWIVGAIVVVVLALSLTGGFGSFLVMLGIIALVTGIYVVITRRRSWARLPASRAFGAGVIVAALIVTGVGGGISAAGHPQRPSSVNGVALEPATTADAPTITPTPTATTDSEQNDPAAVTQASELASVVAADASVTSGTASEILATLAVKGRAPKTGYDRVADFGVAWLDVDRNGCDTRNDILARDLSAITKSGSCKVLAGSLSDPYTGKSIAFVRGESTSTAVQIDHVVALSDAWQKGAQQLTSAQRVSLANDPLNLYAVDGATNEAKSDGDAATWLPPNKAFRCEYAARQVSVKATYGLWVTQAEHDALSSILGGCPDQRAESSAFTPAAVGKTVPVPAPVVEAPAAPEPQQVAPAAPAPVVPEPAAPQPDPPAAVDPGPSVSYKNCTEARAAGVTPLYRGDPGYSSKLDRDGDGIACE